MSVEALKAACDTKETYANLPAGQLAAVCKPHSLGLPVAMSLFNLARSADPEKVVSFPAEWGRQILDLAGKTPDPPAVES